MGCASYSLHNHYSTKSYFTAMQDHLNRGRIDKHLFKCIHITTIMEVESIGNWMGLEIGRNLGCYRSMLA
jgi:hypothetical protein